MSDDDALSDAQPDSPRPSDAEDSFDELDDGRELDWGENDRSLFVPRNWPRIYPVEPKHHRNLSLDEMRGLLKNKRCANETRESMATRLDAAHRIAMRKAARRFGPKQRLLDHIDRFLLLVRAHYEWIDEHHTHADNRLRNRPFGSESVHVERLLRLRAAVVRTSLDPFCTSHDRFVFAMEKRCRRLNKLSREVLTHVQNMHTCTKRNKHYNWILRLDIERTF